MGVITINAAKKAEIDAKLAQVALDAWFAGVISEGFSTEDGWKLGLQADDVTLLTGQFVLAKEADAAQLPLPPVIDMDGVPHQLSMEDLTALMLAYGQHRANLSAEYSQRKAELA
jgi:hypothetical protein